MLNDLTFNRICPKTDEGNSSHLQSAYNFISKLTKLDPTIQKRVVNIRSLI